ncbi:Leucine-rich repeat-containing protein 48 [Symbiodinium microadriaticum]|uniref:Dynein regulatory complex subunit 3 n=1 Tax=Symbiodinium microadriaticum TaxID=2951 RepID=A0A1Q9EGD1_SYMMI|nr:Leucine-rich repeat-containing protein 48 [Symbiodinium microadriaticum]
MTSIVRRRLFGARSLKLVSLHLAGQQRQVVARAAQLAGAQGPIEELRSDVARRFTQAAQGTPPNISSGQLVQLLFEVGVVDVKTHSVGEVVNFLMEHGFYRQTHPQKRDSYGPAPPPKLGMLEAQRWATLLFFRRMQQKPLALGKPMTKATKPICGSAWCSCPPGAAGTDLCALSKRFWGDPGSSFQCEAGEGGIRLENRVARWAEVNMSLIARLFGALRATHMPAAGDACPPFLASERHEFTAASHVLRTLACSRVRKAGNAARRWQCCRSCHAALGCAGRAGVSSQRHHPNRLRVLQQKYEFKLSKFAEDHRWPEALSMLQTMRDRMLDPSEPSRALVVKALSLAGRWIRAFDMLSKLQKWCAARQQAPSSLALSSGVFACKKGAQWRVALVLLAEAENYRCETLIQPQLPLKPREGGIQGGWLMADALASLGQGSSNANVAKIAIEQRKKKAEVVEPQVISEELLIEGVEEPVRTDGKAWPTNEFPQVTSLRLSFKNIIEISNLNNFDTLLTLRLDNNIIDKVSNLGHLRQLTWLDLSFNNIREIEGLDDLHELLDLSLYHNQIEEIKDRLDGCPKLNILSLGHNNMKDLKQIDYLRQFANLRCLCMEGNKVCNHDSYNQHVLAYLPHLKYLDYMLIDRKAVAQAQEGYNLEELTEVREKEQAEHMQQKAKAEKSATIEKLKTAFLDCTEDLFEEMFSREVEPENVLVLQCYQGLKEDYRDKLSEEIKGLRARMEEKNEVRLRKVSAFEKAIYASEKESEDEAFQQIRDFKSVKKKVLSQVDKEDGARAEVDDLLKHLLDELGDLENQLMANEIALQESIEEALSDFEAKTMDLVKSMLDNSREFFTRLEDLEKSFLTGLTEGANSEIEAFTQTQESAMADTDPQKAKYLNNREEMNQALTNFTDAHNSLITNKDDYMTNQMNSWNRAYFENHRARQYNRNRQRVRVS